MQKTFSVSKGCFKQIQIYRKKIYESTKQIN